MSNTSTAILSHGAPAPSPQRGGWSVVSVTQTAPGQYKVVGKCGARVQHVEKLTADGVVALDLARRWVQR